MGLSFGIAHLRGCYGLLQWGRRHLRKRHNRHQFGGKWDRNRKRSPSGNLTLNLTDSPFSDAKSVLVTFSEVQVHSSSGSWVTVPFAGGNTSRTCDLMMLVGSQNVLGTGPLPAGHYTMIRLVVTQSTLYFDNPTFGPACSPSITPPLGLNAPLEISSGEIKLNREFDIIAGRPTTILLDFDGDQSIHQTGNNRYRMNPVIGIVSVQS